MKYLKFKISVLITFLMFNSAVAQITVEGQVTDAKTGEGLPGANIIEKGTGNIVITDLSGNYKISVQGSESILVTSYVGYEKLEIKIGGSSVINFQLKPDASNLDEVVVVGYTTQKKKDLTGAVSIVDVEEVSEAPYANVLQSLQGRISGVTLSQDGQPGSGRTQVRIRGNTSLNNNNPLYVVDGIPTVEPLDNLNPNDIESIQVLKDAAAASIYGSRSAAGVIVITTKKGKKGKINIDAGVIKGVQTLANRVEVLNAQEWGELYYQAARNSNRIPNLEMYGGRVENPQIITDRTFETQVPDGVQSQLYQFTENGTDWADAVYRSAKNDQYYANITSGSDKGSFGLGFSYFDQDGIVDKTFYDRITGRVNSNYKITDWINVGENLSVSYTNQVQTGSQSSSGGIPYQVIRQHPALPIYDINDSYAGGNVFVGGLAFPNAINPVSVLDRAKDNTSKSYRIFGNAYLDANLFKPFKGLSEKHDLIIKTNLGLDYSNFFNRNFEPQFREGGFSNPVTRLSNTYGQGTTLTWINTLNYQYNSVNHKFKALFGMEAVQYEFKDLFASGSGYEIEELDYVQVGVGEERTGGGGAADWALLSYFGRLDYSFDDRYLIGATLRYDETSRLLTTGIFPAFSFGWNLHNESFAKPIFENEILDILKLRVSWGQQGNQTIGNYSIYSTFGPDRSRADYDINGDNETVQSGLITAQRGNLDLKWETTTQTNIGIDAFLFNSSVELGVDYYYKLTEDILRTPLTLSADGEGNPPPRNSASLSNEGVDFNISYYYKDSNSDFHASTSLQTSFYRTEVISLGQNVGSLGYEGELYEVTQGSGGVARIATGYAFPYFYGYVADGIFKNDEEVQAHAEQDGKAPGRLKYKDINGPNGEPDGIINDFDRTYLGTPNPDVSFGLNIVLNYKDFTLSSFLYSSIGQEVYNFTKQNTDFFEPNFNVGKRILDAWSPENPDASIPAPQLTATNNERRASSYFIEDASYLRMRSVRLNYQLPSAWMNNFNVNIYGEVQNVFTITNYTGLDPEVPYAGNANVFGVDQGIYPLPRTFLLGLNIKL